MAAQDVGQRIHEPLPFVVGQARESAGELDTMLCDPEDEALGRSFGMLQHWPGAGQAAPARNWRVLRTLGRPSGHRQAFARSLGPRRSQALDGRLAWSSAGARKMRLGPKLAGRGWKTGVHVHGNLALGCRFGSRCRQVGVSGGGGAWNRGARGCVLGLGLVNGLGARWGNARRRRPGRPGGTRREEAERVEHMGDCKGERGAALAIGLRADLASAGGHVRKKPRKVALAFRCDGRPRG